jgi:hypothetical protein
MTGTPFFRLRHGLGPIPTMSPAAHADTRVTVSSDSHLDAPAAATVEAASVPEVSYLDPRGAYPARGSNTAGDSPQPRSRSMR